MAACILHNICILENDNIEYFLQQVTNVRFMITYFINLSNELTRKKYYYHFFFRDHIAKWIPDTDHWEPSRALGWVP